MPLGLDNALSIAKSGLHLNQYLINIHGQNVINADNPDYARKNVDIESTTPISNVTPGSIGTGVRITDVNRVIDQFLEVQISKNDSEIGNYEVINKYMQQIEKIFNNTDNGSLSNAFNDFWNAWNDLANNPADEATRMTLLEKTNTLDDYIKDIYNKLDRIGTFIDEELKGKVDEINSITEQIATLNKNIFQTEINENNHANDLRDQRDKLIKDLSKIVDINYVEENNQFNIFLNNGTALVTGIFNNELVADGNPDNRNRSSVYWTDNSENKIDISDTIRSGELKGLLYLRDNIVGEYKDRLNYLANGLMRELNYIHSNGVGLEGFSSVTGSVKVDDSSLPFNFAGLESAVSSGSFDIIVYDSSGNATAHHISIGDPEDFDNPDTKVNSLDELQSVIDGFANISASIVNNKLKIVADSGYTFAFANDNSKVLSALGINTYFKGENYSLTKNIDIVGTEEGTLTGTNPDLYQVKAANRNLLTGHTYKIEVDDSGNVTVTDENTNETVSGVTGSTVNGHYTLDFDGIRMQFEGSDKAAITPTAGNTNTYYINNATATSVIDNDNFTDHVFRVDFSKGTSNATIFDVTGNITLDSDDFTKSSFDVDGDGNNDYTTFNISTYGVTVTVKVGSYGVVQITPDKIGAKNIDLNITNTDYIAAAKVQAPAADDSDADTAISDVEITSVSDLTNKKYTVVADGTGGYTITDADGNSITPTAQAADSVTFDGIKLTFDGNTTNSDVYYVDSGKLIFSEGDNRNALDIADLRDDKVLDENSETFTDYISTFMAKVGYDSSFIKNKVDAVNITKEGLQKQRDNVSGVSIDEEMTKLIQIQHSYSATAKLLTVVDSLLKNLIQAVQ